MFIDFCHFFQVHRCSWIQTLDLRSSGWMLYHCSNHRWLTITRVYFYLLFFKVTSGNWAWTLDLRNSGWMLYHCATTNGVLVPFFQVPSSGWIQTLDLRISGWVLYHYAITAGIPSTHVCFLLAIFSRYWLVAWFEPQISGWLVEWSTKVLPLMDYNHKC
jgi:hypothetical protein